MKGGPVLFWLDGLAAAALGAAGGFTLKLPGNIALAVATVHIIAAIVILCRYGPMFFLGWVSMAVGVIGGGLGFVTLYSAEGSDQAHLLTMAYSANTFLAGLGGIYVGLRNRMEFAPDPRGIDVPSGD